MKSKNGGRNTSKIEVNTSSFGIWLLLNGVEYFLNHKDFPWFQNARLCDIHNVELLGRDHLYWPNLDVNLHLDSLINVEKYPLIYH